MRTSSDAEWQQYGVQEHNEGSGVVLSSRNGEIEHYRLAFAQHGGEPNT